MSTLVTSQEPKFEFEFLDGLQAIRNSLTANILKKIITGFYTFNTDERDYLLGYIPVDAMENGSNENASDIEDQTPESEDQTPESEDQTPESEAQTPESIEFRGFQCPYCNSHFTQKSNLKTHVRLKHKEMFEKTDFSKISFIDSKDPKDSDIDKSMRNFKCEICNKTFQQNWRLNRHEKQTHGLKVHEEKMPYECPFCDVKIKLEHNLKVHIKHKHKGAIEPIKDQGQQVHEKNKPRKNNIEFQKHGLKVHEEDMPYQCPFCDVKIKLEHNLKIHIKHKHKETIEPLKDQGKLVHEKKKHGNKNKNVHDFPNFQNKHINVEHCNKIPDEKYGNSIKNMGTVHEDQNLKAVYENQDSKNSAKQLTGIQDATIDSTC